MGNVKPHSPIHLSPSSPQLIFNESPLRIISAKESPPQTCGPSMQSRRKTDPSASLTVSAILEGGVAGRASPVGCPWCHCWHLRHAGGRRWWVHPHTDPAGALPESKPGNDHLDQLGSRLLQCLVWIHRVCSPAPHRLPEWISLRPGGIAWFRSRRFGCRVLSPTSLRGAHGDPARCLVIVAHHHARCCPR